MVRHLASLGVFHVFSLIFLKTLIFVVSTFVFYLPLMVLFVNLCAHLGSVKLSLSVQKSRMQMCEFGTIPIAFLTKKFCLVLAQSFLFFAAQKGYLLQYEGATLKLVFNVAIVNVRGILRIESFSFMLPSIG